jgi:putative nucleotidyltransferase with HDIG domain
MSTGVDFLTGIAQAVSTMSLYEEGHPARERAIDRAYAALSDLQDQSTTAAFTFLGDEIVLDHRPMRELKHWDWGGRFAAVGIQRLEFTGRVTREDFDAFLEEAFNRLTVVRVSSAAVRQGRPTNIRYGEVGLRGEDETTGAAGATVSLASLGYSLREEIETVEWLHSELKDERQLRLLEAEGIVRSMSVAMHGDQAFLIPMLRLKEFDQYTVTHTLNVAVLTMALAEYLGLGPREVRGFGIAGLLHDLGKVSVPLEILNKPGKLSDEERLLIETHPVEGARIILRTEEHLDLAAVVAYEHHIRIDGGGYPGLRYARSCHQASNLVHVCDVFDALRTRRPYREAWPTERALRIIEEGAGPEFDADIARAFVAMMRQWEDRVIEVGTDDPELRLGGVTGPEASAAPPPGTAAEGSSAGAPPKDTP